MSVTKYIVPAVMIVGGFFTGGATWAGGAMIAGGAIDAIGQAKGSKDLIQGGQMLGAIGGIGAATGIGTGTIGESFNAAPAATDAAASQGVSSGAVDKQLVADTSGGNTADQSLAGKLLTQDNNSVGAAALNSPTASAADSLSLGTRSAAPQGIFNANGQSSGLADYSAPPPDQNLADMIQLKKYSLISGAVQGAGNAIGARTQADIQAQTAADQLALARQRVGIANSVGTVPSLGLLSNSAPAAPAPIPHAL